MRVQMQDTQIQEGRNSGDEIQDIYSRFAKQLSTCKCTNLTWGAQTAAVRLGGGSPARICMPHRVTVRVVGTKVLG